MKSKTIITVVFTAIAIFSLVVFVACENNLSESTSFTVNFDANGGEFLDGSVVFTQQNIKNGGTIVAPTTPTRKNYTFCGWATDKAGKNLWKFASDTVSSNLTLYAMWEQASAVLISLENATIDEMGKTAFMFVDKDTANVNLSDKIIVGNGCTWKLYKDALGQTEITTKIAAQSGGTLSGGDNLFYVVITSSNGLQSNTYTLTIHRSQKIQICYRDGNKAIKTVDSYSGISFVADYVPTISGYTFNGWKLNGEDFTETILWKNTDLVADKTANTYICTVKANGGEISAEPIKVTYGTSYSLPVPTYTGYTFLGYTVNNKLVTSSGGNSLSAWNFPKDTELTAKWSLNSYYVSLNVNDSVAGTVSGGGNYAFNTKVTITASTNSGYTWIGWFDGETKLTNDLFYRFTVSAEDITFTAKWIKVSFEYNIPAAGTVKSLDAAYKVGDEVTTTAEPNLGYNFVGWYNEGRLLTNELAFTFFMPDCDTRITAQFETKEEMNNFIFASTLSTCTINGVNDKTNETISVPNYVTTISYGVFEKCYNLTKIILPFVGESRNSTKRYFGYVFGAASAAENNHYVPQSLKTVELTDETEIALQAFLGCNSLTEVIIPDSVTRIELSAFLDCSSLIQTENGIQYVDKWVIGCDKSVVNAIPRANTVGIADSAFYNCSISNITIPDKVSSIGFGAFHGCNLLKKIEFPSSVIRIGRQAFYGCSALTSVKLDNTINWAVSNSLEFSSAILLAGSDVSNCATVAKYLTSKYVDYYWKCNSEN